MRLLLGLLAGLATIGCAWAQEPQLAAEGRGLLPEPTTMLPTLQGAPPQDFVSDPSGGFSRTIFETDQDPNFKVIIRDFSFPPDRQPHSVALPSGAFLHILGGDGRISIAEKQLALSTTARMTAPAGAPIEVVNNGEQHVIVRALIVEAK
jgi:hypothetical protein